MAEFLTLAGFRSKTKPVLANLVPAFESAATGLYSRATGRNTLAAGTASFAAGNGVVADQENGTAIGQFNALDTEGALFVIGNGAGADMRSNAFEVHSDGNAIIHGNAQVDGTIIAGNFDVASTLGSLVSTVDSLQSVIAELQAQLEALSGGE